MTKFCARKIKECRDFVSQYGLIDHGGATLKQFCKAMDIDEKSYRNWMKNSRFSDAIKEAKEIYKNQSEFDLIETLKRVAVGYDQEETRTEFQPNPQDEGRPRIVKQIKTKKYISPNIGAAIFLLTNIAPERWQNRSHSDIALKKESAVMMTREEIEKELQRLSELDNLEDATQHNLSGAEAAPTT